MKKILSFIAVLIFVFTACDSGDIHGGRYYGTFQNTTNNKRESGSLSFKYENTNNHTGFFMNGILPLVKTDKNKFSGDVGNYLINDLLETIPAIDSLQVCDSAETITQISAEAKFQSNSVKATLFFTKYPDSAKVMVEFVGYTE